MSFHLVSILAALVSLPFALAFIAFPEVAGTYYGVTGWTPGTSSIARLFGAAFLFLSLSSFVIRDVTDRALQKRLAIVYCSTSIVAGALCAQAAVSGAMNSLMWSSVAIYVFFTLAWAIQARR